MTEEQNNSDRLTELERLNAELLIKNAQLEKVRNRRITQALVALVAVGLAITINILYVGYNQQRSDQRWCALMVGLDDNYRAAPPGSLPPRTQTFADSVKMLRKDFKCANTPMPTVQGLGMRTNTGD